MKLFTDRRREGVWGPAACLPTRRRAVTPLTLNHRSRAFVFATTRTLRSRGLAALVA
jgi:hypothetical protein